MSMRYVTAVRRPAVVLGAALLTLLLLPAVAAGTGVAVTDADNGKTVVVIPNTTVTMTLESNASTGYSWEVLTAPDATIAGLLPGAGKYTEPATKPTSPPIVGAPGTQTFAIRSHALGNTKIVLGYIPPAGSKPGKTFALDIRVVTVADLPNTSTTPEARPAAPPIGLLVGLFAVLAVSLRLVLRRLPRQRMRER
jgi:predicted secreted protein